MKKNLTQIFIVLIIGLSLLNWDFFMYESQSSYFSFIIFSSALTLFTSLILFKEKVNESNRSLLTHSVLFTFLLSLYFFIHYFSVGDSFTIKHKYYIIGCMLCCTLQILSILNLIRPYYIFHSISLFVGLESLICFAQYLGFQESKNAFFRVTGTWVNPNVTAMFIAISSPIIFSYVFTLRNKSRFLFFCLGCASLLSLFLLECRTAIIGFCIALIYFLQARYNFSKLLKKTKQIPSKVFLIFLGFAILVSLSAYAYNSKKASAEGRLFIWELSAKMIKEKPILGFGYGTFEKNYNLFQANHFKSTKATPSEKQNASHVKMAYNEFVEACVEGGVIGLLILVNILGYLTIFPILKMWKNNSATTFRMHDTPNSNEIFRISHAGVIIFTVMSFVNFTIAAVPVFFIFLIYAALLTTTTDQNAKSVNFSHKLFTLILFVSACYVSVDNLKDTYNQLKIKKAHSYLQNSKIKAAFNEMAQVSVSADRSEIYHRILGKIYWNNKQYDSALLSFKRSIQISSAPDMYVQIGDCYQKLNNNGLAIEAYEIALNIQPNRFYPRILLMRAYLKQQDTTRAISIAEEIIKLKPKVINENSMNSKREAETVYKYRLKS